MSRTTKGNKGPGNEFLIDADLNGLSKLGLMKEIMRLRSAIRYARNAENDEKCWLDMFRLFELLPEKLPMNKKILSKEQMLSNCKTFIDCMHCHLNNPATSIDEAYEVWEREKPY